MTGSDAGGGDLLAFDEVNALRGQIEILHAVSLTVPRRGVTGLIGPNGAGKTTTIMAIAGLVRVGRGRVIYDGADITALAPRDRLKRGIAVVPEGRRLFPELTVEENVCFGSRTLGLHGPESRMGDLFPVLTARWHSRARELSGGEQQMVAIARALMCEPTLLVLDEPSLGLAPRVVDEIYAVVQELAREMAVLVVEQFTDRVLKMSQRAHVLSGGALIASGSGSDLLGTRAVEQAYFG